VYRKLQVTFDCADPSVMTAFWGPALDYVPDPPPEGYDSWDAFATEVGIPRERWNDSGAVVDPTGEGPRLFFQRVPEPKLTKNRVHLDVAATRGRDQPIAERRAAVAGKVRQLVALGATEVETIEEDGGVFTVMRDPEGNEFCVH
jgi:Glyoxalase-like domain